MPKRYATLEAALRLGLFTAVTAALLLGVQQLTAQRVAAQIAQRYTHELRRLAPDSDMPDPAETRTLASSRFAVQQPVQLLALRQKGQLRAWVFDLTTPHGYSGAIRLLVAIDSQGTVLGSRILQHRETPGLGDRIEPQHSPWLIQFFGLDASLAPSAWRWRREGGQIDSLSGATISALAIRNAIRHCVEFYRAELQPLSSRP